MKVERTKNDVVVNALPDGSRVIIDSKSDRVYALNATAGAAWDACRDAKTLAEVTASMRKSLSPAVSEEMAEEAIRSLQEQNLVIASSSTLGPSRRQVLATLGVIALPLVVSMTLGEQKAYAHDAGSGKGEMGDGGTGGSGGWNPGDGGNGGSGGDGNPGDGGDGGNGGNGGNAYGQEGGREHQDHLDHGTGNDGLQRVIRTSNGAHS